MEHLKSQNHVLSLTLEESKATCDGLTELLGRLEIFHKFGPVLMLLIDSTLANIETRAVRSAPHETNSHIIHFTTLRLARLCC